MGWKGEALLALRRARNPPDGVFFLITFSFAPMVSKEKVAKDFRLFQDGASRTSPPTMFVRGRTTVDAPMVSKRKVAKGLENLTPCLEKFFMHGNSFRHGFAVPPPAGGRLKVVCSQRTVAEAFRLFKDGRFVNRLYGVCARADDRWSPLRCLCEGGRPMVAPTMFV